MENNKQAWKWAAAIDHIKKLLGKVKYGLSWNLFVRYCITPPVTIPFDRSEAAKEPGRLSKMPIQPLTPKECRVCGRVHITSEICGREPSETERQESGPYPDNGYKLMRAAGMGFFDDV